MKGKWLTLLGNDRGSCTSLIHRVVSSWLEVSQQL